ncbi:hypothetical protein PybrP1_010746 [[Pythium] brassicae (nom. inval.)]|nr:hypothetical protein PybrP1_010746 [[Pythium] brassicae (nom. inval.)]
MGGGFGFGMLADVQMLGFYQAHHARTRKPFLAYVLQVSTAASAHFLIYRRYSQIAALATKLHFQPAVGLPPKYALQVFPLTEEQLRQRFEGLQAFMAHVFAHLRREFDDGAQHDVASSAGLDMQIFYDFVAHHRNRPPAAVRAIPEWARPTMLQGAHAAAGGSGAAFPYARSRSSSASSLGGLDSAQHGGRRSTWQDVDSVTDSEGVGGVGDRGDDDDEVEDDGGGGCGGGGGGLGPGDSDAVDPADAKLSASDEFRNELLQAEGNLNALWNCVKAYTRATNAWWAAAGAVADEYKRVGEMSLFNTPTPKAPTTAASTVATPSSCDAGVTPPAEAPGAAAAVPPAVASLTDATSSDRLEAGSTVAVTAPIAVASPHSEAQALKRVRNRNRSHPTRLASAHNRLAERLLPEFADQCDERVLSPLDALVREALPEVKHSYWTRLASSRPEGSGVGGATARGESVNLRRLLQERELLHSKIRTDVQASMAALVTLQNELLRAVQDTLQPFETAAVAACNTTASAANNASLLPSPSLSLSLSLPLSPGGASARQREEDAADDAALERGAGEHDLRSVSEQDEASESGRRDSVGSPTVVVSRREGDENEASNGQHDDKDNNDKDDKDACGDKNDTDDDEEEDDDDDEDQCSRVWVWGRPPTVESGTPLVLRPKQVALLKGQSVLQVACGGEHLLYLTDTGDVYSFGDKADNAAAAKTLTAQPSQSPQSPSPSPSQQQQRRQAARGGAVSFLAPRLVEELALEKALHRTKIVKVACGAQHSVGITEVGELYTWGSGEDGRLGHGDMRDRAVARKVMSLLRERVVHASCGGAHTAVLTDAHEVFTFGRGRNGRLGLGDTKWRDTPHPVTAFARRPPTREAAAGAAAAVVHVVCGWNFTAALARDGSVYTWGKQGEGQCGLGYVDKDQLVPRVLERLRQDGARVVDLACGYTHTVALTAAGDVYSWGLGEYGQLGRGVVYQPVPERVDFAAVLGAPDRVARVYCGAFHSVATTRARVVLAWGLNMYGACGLGHTANKDTPARVASFLRGATTELVVACGHKYTIALEVAPEEAVVPAHKVRLSATQPPWQAARGGGDDWRCGAGGVGVGAVGLSSSYLSSSYPSPPPPLNMSVIAASASSSSIEWTATTPTDFMETGELTPTPTRTPTPTIPYHAPPPPLSLSLSSSLSSVAVGPLLAEAPAREAIHEKEEELRRAKKLWRTRVLRDWEASKDTPLAHALWRQGIPPSVRAKVWPLAIGNKLKVTPEMFQIYRRRAAAYKQHERGRRGSGDTNTSSSTGDSTVIGREHTLALIDTDLPRTFPSLKLFDASGPYYAFLLEVLETYACYRPDLGYIQGMSYLAALLCLHMPQDRFLAFQCLANLMVHEHLFTFYLLDAELAGVYYALFSELLSARLPALHRHLAAIGVSGSMYLMNWLQTLFLQVLPLELAARVVDNFLLDGTVFLFRTALALHELLQADLLRADLDEAMPIIQKSPLYHDLWLARVSEHELFRAIAAVVVPSHIYAALDRVVNDVFFYDKQPRKLAAGSGGGGGGQSVGIGRVKRERRRMYSISDTLNGVLGGF